MYAKTNANSMSNVSGGGGGGDDDDDNDWEFKLRREMSMALLSASAVFRKRAGILVVGRPGAIHPDRFIWNSVLKITTKK